LSLPARRQPGRSGLLCRRESLAALAGLGLLAAAGPGRAQAGASALPEIVARTKPSVLPVGSFNPTDSPRFSFRGSGFVIAQQNGLGNLLATNFHVLPDGAGGAGGPQMAVLTGQGPGAESQRRLARVVASERLHDLALLQIEGPPLPGLVLEAPGQVREGQAVALMGFPIGGTLGFSVVTHRGIVASITSAAMPAPSARQLDPRAVSRLREGNFELLQLDATAYPGNSGGPVLDAETGRVIGIVNMVLVKAGRESALSSPTGITYAVPVALLRALMQRQ
jgi:serine protease Do